MMSEAGERREYERRRVSDRVIEQVGFLRADISLMSTKVDRLDERTARIEKALFYGNGHEPLTTQIAIVRQSVEDTEKRASRAGATYGTLASSIVAAIAGAIWYVLQSPIRK